MLVKILTPTATILDESCDQIIVDSVNGKMGILKDHCTLTTLLRPGEIRIENQQQWKTIATSAGLLKVDNNQITILLDS